MLSARVSNHRRAVARLLLICVVVGGGAAACKEPSEVLATHFESMALIAERHKDDCGAMGAQLQSYLSDNASAITDAASKLGESSDVQAKRISVATRRIDVGVESCRGDAAVDAYARQIGTLTLEATGIGRP